MKVTPIKTKTIVVGDKLQVILDQALPTIENNSVIAITSKIVSICEGSVVKIGSRTKDELIKEQAEYYLPENEIYHFTLTIKHNVLIPSAGIDESNGNGYYILWPENPQQTVNAIREYLQKKHNVTNIGVIIVDSKTMPLRWGVTGICIVHSGFNSLNDYVGTPDIFGRPFQVEKVNVADALAASAVLLMGEGNEQTPIAVINDIPFVQFQDRNPSQEELDILAITIDEDLYSPLLKGVRWQKGGQNRQG
jgi:dihydrofolate synthase / folylpolyglutamate synthase